LPDLGDRQHACRRKDDFAAGLAGGILFF